MKAILVYVLISVWGEGVCQQVPQQYFVAFTNKTGTPYSIGNPQAFLSQRAIDRRIAQGIAVTEEDLPVNPSYVVGVTATGVQVYYTSKWFNGLVMKAADSSVLPAIRSLPYVLSVTRVSEYTSAAGKTLPGKNRNEKRRPLSEMKLITIPTNALGYNYGPSFTQIHLEKGDVLHNLGYRGQGKLIAVLDDGFLNVDINTGFDSLRINNLILGTRDFVTPGGDVYRADNHGAGVLSIMAANDPGDLIGTAPMASYWLMRTDDAAGDNIVEENNWGAGAELADSVGADIISSSVGYNVFDNNWMNHDCSDMNGVTNPSTKGANIAANKGIGVSLTVGNSGGSGWTCVLSPSDATNALGVASVDSNGIRAPSSANGIVNGSYIKPNIACMGVNCRVVSPDNSFGYVSGTSYATAINAGLMACLWQAWPSVSQVRLSLAVEQSSSQYSQPDSLLGYGIPDFSKAMLILGVPNATNSRFQAYPNPFRESIQITFDRPISGPAEVSIISPDGKTISKERKNALSGGMTMELNGLGYLSAGMYIIRISSGSTTEYLHLIKLEN